MVTFTVITREHIEPKETFYVWASRYAQSWRTHRRVSTFVCVGFGFVVNTAWKFRLTPHLRYTHFAVSLRLVR